MCQFFVFWPPPTNLWVDAWGNNLQMSVIERPISALASSRSCARLRRLAWASARERLSACPASVKEGGDRGAGKAIPAEGRPYSGGDPRPPDTCHLPLDRGLREVSTHTFPGRTEIREYAYTLYSEAHNILYVTVGTCEPIPRIVWNAAIGVRRRLNLKAYSSR